MHLIPIPEGVHTRYFVLGSGVLVELPGLLREAFPGMRPYLVADENTFAAAGERVLNLLKAAGADPVIGRIFPGSPVLRPDDRFSVELASAFPERCVPVAVGSGVINDLVKRASGLRNIPYCCAATAASVDGYTSSGAALLVNGRKMTQPCPAPYAILADAEILRAAPPAMLSAGYGDLLAKVPAGAEWKIAESLGIEGIPRNVWNLVQPGLRKRVSDPHDLTNIFDGLASAGFALQLYGDSRPGSGAEHLVSHVLDMEDWLFRGEHVSHGFQVAVGTVATTRLLEYVSRLSAAQAASDAAPLQDFRERETEIDRLLIRGCYGNAKETAVNKFLSGTAAAERRNRIFAHWDGWKSMLAEQLIPSGELIGRLHGAGCPALPEEIGLDAERFRHTLMTAQLIRKRWTVLDLLYESGLLAAALDSLK